MCPIAQEKLRKLLHEHQTSAHGRSYLIAAICDRENIRSTVICDGLLACKALKAKFRHPLSQRPPSKVRFYEHAQHQARKERFLLIGECSSKEELENFRKSYIFSKPELKSPLSTSPSAASADPVVTTRISDIPVGSSGRDPSEGVNINNSDDILRVARLLLKHKESKEDQYKAAKMYEGILGCKPADREALEVLTLLYGGGPDCLNADLPKLKACYEKALTHLFSSKCSVELKWASKILEWFANIYLIKAKGWETDYVKAKMYLERSLGFDFKNTGAQLRLSQLLSEDREGVPKDLRRSEELFLAYAQNMEKSIEEDAGKKIS